MKKLFGVLAASAAVFAVTGCGDLTDLEKSTIIANAADQFAEEFFATRIDYDTYSNGIDLPSKIGDVNISAWSAVYIEDSYYETNYAIEDNKLYYVYRIRNTVSEPSGMFAEHVEEGLVANFEYQGHEVAIGYDYEKFATRTTIFGDYEDIPKMLESYTPVYKNGESIVELVPDIYSEKGWRIRDYRISMFGCKVNDVIIEGSSGYVEEGLVHGQQYDYIATNCSGTNPGYGTRMNAEYTIEMFNPSMPEVYRKYTTIENYTTFTFNWPSA